MKITYNLLISLYSLLTNANWQEPLQNKLAQLEANLAKQKERNEAKIVDFEKKN